MLTSRALRNHAAVTVGTVLCAATLALAADRPSASEALARLKAGNERFATDASALTPIDHDRRTVLSKGQSPFATVLSCADSRVPPEIVFNTGLGDLFVVRAAGEVVDRSVLGSVEYALEHLHTPVLVVMGHAFCGAVTAAMDTKTSLGPNLDFMLQAIRPAVLRTANVPEKERLKAAILANVEVAVNDALAQSKILRHLVESGAVTIVGAYYELDSGRVTFSQPVSAVSGADAAKAEPRR
jgi:carbonic anhydrase